MGKNNEIRQQNEDSILETELAVELKALINQIEGLDEYRLPQRAYHIIRIAIRDLILPPGKTILEREMAEILDMSRTPVREALVRLETEGVVRLIPRRGFIVKPIEKEDLQSVFEIVETLEGLGAELATKQIGAKEIAQLDELLAEQEKALAHGDLKKWSVLDNEFHHLIIKFANNRHLSGIIDSFTDQTHRARLYTIKHRPIPHHSVIEHRAVVKCMEANDPNAARVVMESHRRRSRQEILEALEKIKE
jgi:GntR family transcriptional regulator, rspAB operon transcriptional repressor